ncbi:MAG: cysteine desulfurase [Lachnospiraceae bacterium]|nr:cysteine desulfurase [Lachnospiraceae bacterium]
MSPYIYLDHAATTPMKKEVMEEMLPYFTEQYANPSAIYEFAVKSKDAMDTARKNIAATLGVKPQEIYFTSGGTESDNWAILKTAEALKTKGNHIITSKIEHHAVLHTLGYMESIGYEVTYLDVDKQGRINLKELEDAIRKETILITIMTANNEIGTIQPIRQIGRIAKERGVLFHTDGVQAYGHIPIFLPEYSVDLFSASGHKFYGPKGIGFLYVKENTPISSLLKGGGQERKLRAGTENVASIVGMGKAAKLVHQRLGYERMRETNLRNYFMNRILREINDVKINGSLKNRLCNNINLTFSGVEGEALLIMLDSEDICVATGSACNSKESTPSHVLLAIGLSEEEAYSTIRITIGETTQKKDLDQTVEALKLSVANLRKKS